MCDHHEDRHQVQLAMAVYDYDHVLVRAQTVCPLCLCPKDKGLVACWSCYREQGLKYGNSTAERRIDLYEQRLAKIARDWTKAGPASESDVRLQSSYREFKDCWEAGMDFDTAFGSCGIAAQLVPAFRKLWDRWEQDFDNS